MVLREYLIITCKQNTLLIYFVCLCLRKQELSLSLSSCMQKLLIQFFLFIANKLVFALHIGDYIQITKLVFIFYFFIHILSTKRESSLEIPYFFLLVLVQVRVVILLLYIYFSFLRPLGYAATFVLFTIQFFFCK